MQENSGSYYNSNVSNNVVSWHILGGIKLWRIWAKLAMGEIRARYGRTVLGASWNIVTFASFCLAIIYFIGPLMAASDPNYGPHVVIGFLVYTFISGLVTDGSMVYITSASWISSVRLPWSVYVFKVLFRNIIIFGFNLIAAIGILFFYYEVTLAPVQLYAVLWFFNVVVFGVGLSMFLGAICVRFRDMIQMIQTVMRFALFITPIMWVANGDNMRSKIAEINPLTHIIESVRHPFVHGEMAMKSSLIFIAIALFMLTLGIITTSVTRRRLIYWL